MAASNKTAKGAKKPPAKKAAAKATKKGGTKKGAAGKSAASKPAAAVEATTLPAKMDIATTSACKTLLQEALSQGQDTVVLDGSAVERVTTPGMQMLLSLARAAEDSQKKVQLMEPSAALCEALTDIGLGSMMEEWRKTS